MEPIDRLIGQQKQIEIGLSVLPGCAHTYNAFRDEVIIAEDGFCFAIKGVMGKI